LNALAGRVRFNLIKENNKQNLKWRFSLIIAIFLINILLSEYFELSSFRAFELSSFPAFPPIDLSSLSYLIPESVFLIALLMFSIKNQSSL